MGERMVVLFPLPLKSHFDFMMELGRLLQSKGGFSISVICTGSYSPDPACYPNFTFHVIGDSISNLVKLNKMELFFSELNKTSVEPLRECLTLIASAAATVTCLITDSIWYSSQAVANSLGIRRLVLEANMSFFLTAIKFEHVKHCSTEDKEATVRELFPLKIKDLPVFKARDKTLLAEIITCIIRESKAAEGIIFNSFEELESDAIGIVKDALRIPVFTCGPMRLLSPAATATSTANGRPTASCIIPWLDTQPLASVLYISLGTVVSMDKSEFLELAWGIAASKQPFVWSVRPGVVRGSNKEEPMLPEEFMNSIQGRGLVVSWAPQPKVLEHPSVGGFWTHGGWNSILESIHAGVPMICTPFMGDQMSNCRWVSDVWKIGLYFEDDKVERREVEKAIRRLMVDNDGIQMREEAISWKNKCKECVQVGGSSHRSLDKLVEYIGNQS